MKETIELEKKVNDVEDIESKESDSIDQEIDLIIDRIQEKGFTILSDSEYAEIRNKIDKLDFLPNKFSSLVNLVKDLDNRFTTNINNLIEYGKLTEKRNYGMMEVVNLIQSFLTSFSPSQLMKPSFYQNNKHIQFIEDSLKYLNTLFPTESDANKN